MDFFSFWKLSADNAQSMLYIYWMHQPASHDQCYQLTDLLVDQLIDYRHAKNYHDFIKILLLLSSHVYDGG